MSYSCPLCHAPLERRDNSYICPQRHQFDLAKEGYVNLLPVQFKRSRDPGDSAEMMQARRAFLDAGHYQPLRDAICAYLQTFAPTDLLDIGCGTLLPPLRPIAGAWMCRNRLSARRRNVIRRSAFASLPASVCRLRMRAWTR